MRIIKINWLGQEYSENIDDNIELSNLTPVEIRNALNKAVGNFAYYSKLYTDAKDMETQIKNTYNYWYSGKYVNIIKEFPKASAKFIESHIIVEFNDEWKKFETKLRKITKIISMFKVLIDSYKMQIDVLKAISFNIQSELKMITSNSGDMCDE